MNKFDLFVCEYSECHCTFEVINMLKAHRDYLNFCKYDHTVTRIKKDDEKIDKINSIIEFLTIIDQPDVVINLRGLFYD